MTIEQRVDKHERLITALISRLNNDKFYDDADKAGLMQADALNTEGVAEAKAIDGKEYNPNKFNHKGDIVLFGGSFARCLHDNIGIIPTNKIYWELLTAADMILELAARITALEQKEEA